MTIAINCECKAKLEIDESFAGKQITCPDCSALLTVPTANAGSLRTSGFAIASLSLTIIGALTIVGTAIAAALGALALWQINKHPERLGGKRLAMAGVIIGGILTIVVFIGWRTQGFFGLDGLLQSARWLGKLDYTGDLVVKSKKHGFAIERPSRQWGILNSWKSKDTDTSRDLLIVHPQKSLYLLVLTEDSDWEATFDSAEEKGKMLFRDMNLHGAKLHRENFNGAETDFYKKGRRRYEKGNMKILEMRADRIFNGGTRTYLVRIILKKDDNLMYVVAGGTEKDQFDAREEEILKVMDSFRFLRGGVKNNAGNRGP